MKKMRRLLIFILTISLSVCMMACSSSDEKEEAKLTLTEGQSKAVRNSAVLHGWDYNYTLDSITHESLESKGTFLTVTGVVTYSDTSGDKWCGDYTVIIVETDEPDSYKVKSWDMTNLRAIN